MKEASHKRLYTVSVHLYEMSRICKSVETLNRLVVKGWGSSGRVEDLLLMGTDFLRGAAKMS